ncbi:MAG: hypothetical protein GY861_24395 [bacterium]|nr:hypothetical protein [bacterium]
MTLYDIAFDSEHDMYLDGDDMAFTDDDNYITQRLTIRLQFLYEEWFLDTQVGLPFTQFIFEQRSNIDIIYGLFYKEITDTEGVSSVGRMNLVPDVDERTMAVRFIVNNGSEKEVVINI